MELRDKVAIIKGQARGSAPQRHGCSVRKVRRSFSLRAIRRASTNPSPDRLALGGRAIKVEGKGYYIEPTIFADSSNDLTIAREEIFGPVLTVIPVADIAVQL